MNLDLFNKDSSNENGFDAKGHVSLSRGKGFDAYFLIGNSPSLTVLKDAVAMLKRDDGDDSNDHVRILSIEYLPRRRQELLRESKTGFIDSTGNAWVDFENLLIDKKGNRVSGTSSQGGIQSVFADKAPLASRLIFYSGARGIRGTSSMLEDSGLGLTPGYASKEANTLIAEHYAKRTEKGIELINKISACTFDHMKLHGARNILQEWDGRGRYVFRKRDLAVGLEEEERSIPSG